MAELLAAPLNSTDLITALTMHYKMRRPPMVMGPPGIGKSRIMKQVAKKLGIKLKDVRALLMNPVDVNGLPHVQYRTRAMEQLAILFNSPDVPDLDSIAQVFNQTSEVDLYGTTMWSRPGFLPADEAGILLFDELNAAAVEVMAALYQVMLDFQIGDHKLGDGWVPFAAGNRTTDRGVAHKIPTPLRDRLFFYDMVVEWSPWAEWAVTEGDIHPLVIAYLEYSLQDYGAGISDVSDAIKGKLAELLNQPMVSTGEVKALATLLERDAADDVGCGMLHRFNPKADERSFPTPRSWEMVSDAIKQLEAEGLTGTRIEEAMLSGKVGVTAAKEICAFSRAFRLGFTVGDVLMNPDSALVPDEPSMQCGVMNALARAADETNMAQIGTYMERMPEEYGVAFVKRATSRDKLLNKTGWVTKFRVQHADIFA